MLEAVKAVIPSFVSRIERPGRGDVWVDYLSERRAAERRWAERLGLDRDEAGEARSSVELVHVDGDENRLLAALLFEAAGTPEEGSSSAVENLGDDERAADARRPGRRARNRRHRPGRGFEALRYRFEIVSDYGAFRDLQRHRMLTVQWQPLTPDLGAEIPEEVAEAGCGELYERALERSRAEYERLRERVTKRPPRTRCASATGSATSWTSTPARRCTSPSCAPPAKATRPTARSRRRCTPRSRSATRRSRRRCARRPLVRAAPGAHPGRDPRRVAPRVADGLRRRG